MAQARQATRARPSSARSPASPALATDLVSARIRPDPALLKPSPHLIEQAMTGLGAPPAECVLVGDTTTDMQATRLAGIDSIGYANKPGKHDSLAAAGATAVISSLADLVLPLRARPLMPLCQDVDGVGDESVDDQGV